MSGRLVVPMLLATAAIATAAGKAIAADGARIYAEHCAACHDVGGAGVPGIAPPLAGPAAARVKVPGGREYVAQVVVNGITGPFESGGTRQLGTMTPFASLSDAELAAVLNEVLLVYNRGSLPAGFKPIAESEIAAARTPPRSPRDMHKAKEALEKATR